MSSRYQIKAFQAQFPAIFATDGESAPCYKYGAFRWLSEARVARVTPELMQHRPHHERYPYSSREERILLFDRGWTLLGSVAQSESGQIGHTTFSARGETIGEALSRLGCASEVAFVVSISEDEPHEGERAVSVTVHKPPKGWTIPEWVAREEQRAGNALAAQITEIDRVD